MARMLGRKVWDRVYCSCCNGPRTVKAERQREKRELARELPAILDEFTEMRLPNGELADTNEP